MTTSRLGQAIHQVCGKLRGDAELNDGQLLESFLADRQPAALEALVGRHAPMVWGVCRRILSNHHDAEDAFQAAFLVLARKASSIKPRAMVGNWLFGVARQTALKARATTAKRRAREKQITPEIEPIAARADSSGELSALLDDELTKLPDKYRSVLILCGLQGKSLKEAARRLDLPEGTVASRLARGRAMLAKRLVRHGLAVSGVSLAALQAQQSASASVSAAAISSTIKAATTAGAVSANVAALTNGVLKAMLLTKLMKTTAAALVILGVVGVGAMGWAGMVRQAQPPVNPPKQQANKDKTPEQKADNVKEAKKDEDPNIRYQAFSVSRRAVDQDGKPVAGATIFLVSMNVVPKALLGTATTDKDGQYTFHDAKMPYRVKMSEHDLDGAFFQVFGKCPGRAFAWDGRKFLEINSRITMGPVKSYLPTDRIDIDLKFASPKKVEGHIVDEKGKPIAGFKVQVTNCDYINTAGKEMRTNDREFWTQGIVPELMPDQVCATTDAEGRFEFPSVPPDVFCQLLLKHPSYGDMSLYIATVENPPSTTNPYFTADEGQPVRKLPLNLVLHSVCTINVQVRSKQDDKPLAGVRLTGYQQRAAGFVSYGTSDNEGKATLKLPPGKYHLEGLPPRGGNYVKTEEDITVEETPTEQSIVFRQQSGCVLILKAVDSVTGKGIPKVRFWYDTKIGRQQAGTSVPPSTADVDNPRTNENGELRVFVQPGKARYGLGLNLLLSDYEADNPDDLKGREIELPAGKTVTETFKLRKKK